jgi:hypothetical protein
MRSVVDRNVVMRRIPVVTELRDARPGGSNIGSSRIFSPKLPDLLRVLFRGYRDWSVKLNISI